MKRMMTISRMGCTLCCIIAAAAAAGCWREDNNMYHQPSYKPLQPSILFGDFASARPLVPGTISRGESLDEGFTTGWTSEGPLPRIPLPVTMAMLRRGQERFDIYCTPCHGYDGHGEGMIVMRGFTVPPSLHVDRLRALPDGYLYSVIVQGFGRMPPYDQQVNVEDRWAIVAYIRAMQLSQFAEASKLPPSLLDHLEGVRHGQ